MEFGSRIRGMSFALILASFSIFHACRIDNNEKNAAVVFSQQVAQEFNSTILPLPIVVPYNGQPVRTARAEMSAQTWVNLFDMPTLIQSLQVKGLSVGDRVFVRAGTGYTNDLATKKAEAGSSKYKGDNRYTVQIVGTVRQSTNVGVTGLVIAKDARNTDFVQHHGFSMLQGSAQISDPNQNIFNFVLKGKVVGGPTPKIAIGRINQNSTPIAPNGVPSIFMEKGPARTKLDILVLSLGWESAFVKSNYQSDRSHIRRTRITRNGTFVGISYPLGLVRAGDIFDASTNIDCTAVSDSPQLCTHTVVLTDAEDSTEGEEVTIRFGKNVPPRETANFRFFGALTASKDYSAGAFLNVVVKTMSDTTSDGFLKLEKSSVMSFSRYIPLR